MSVKNLPSGLDIAHHHQLSQADFDSLAMTDDGADVVRRLQSAQRSRRLLQLRAFMDAVAENPELYGPLPSPEDAWDLLARVQAHTPAAFQAVLNHPYTGTWLAHVKRLVDKVVNDQDRPIWVQVGHLHALAAAAAIRAGIDFEMSIPAWSGQAILPTLGMALVPGSVAEVRADAGRVRVATVALPADITQDAPGWWGLRRLVVDRLEVRLDDLDPYRDLHEVVPAERTDPDTVKAWDELLDDAWRLMIECVPDFADGFAAGFESLVPRPPIPFRYLSGSTSESFGSAVIAQPADGMLLASALVHEFQHSRLHGIMQLFKLNENDRTQRFYTLWRDDPRPLPGTMHGIYAFFGMTGFWRALANRHGSARAWFEFAYCRTGTWRTLGDVRIDPELTELGRRFLDRIAERLGPWHEESIPDGIAALAEHAAADHYTGWRLRHLRPPAETVNRLADAWLTGTRLQLSTQDDAANPEPDGAWTGARTELIRLRLDEPDRFHTQWQMVPGATEADFAYVSGDPNASTRYKAELKSNPDSVPAWAGLALTTEPDSPAAQALRAHPELVRAVHRTLPNAPAPDTLAAWIGGLER